MGMCTVTARTWQEEADSSAAPAVSSGAALSGFPEVRFEMTQAGSPPQSSGNVHPLIYDLISYFYLGGRGQVGKPNSHK